MTSTQKTILVIGATGKQGGAAVRHLLAKDWHVRALTRDHTQPSAQHLREAGVEVVQGDSEDMASLTAAMQGVYGVFSVQAAAAEAEIRQGNNIADAARAASVEHFVYSSVQNADALARVGGDTRKWAIEQHIWQSGLSATILRPPLFMDNFINPDFQPFYGLPDNYATAIEPDVPMGLIAVDDIGAFAALVFEAGDAYIGQTIEIAGDALNPVQVAAALSHATGRSIPYEQIPLETLAQQSQDIARSIEYLNQAGYPVDIAALKKWHSGLMTFDAWLEREGAAKLRATLPLSPAENHG